jgi:3,4-dihydroxy 2-butanone 4-phosphate synthase / GTP cyclohydrolase II
MPTFYSHRVPSTCFASIFYALLKGQEAVYDTVNYTLSIPEAVSELRAGRMVIICDDESRENEADLCLAAQFATPEAINFLAHHASGLICVALPGERLDTLHIPLAEHKQEPLQGTAFTASVDARYATTTGISARDRATTIRTLINPMTRPHDLARPGHVFPLRARPGGTLERRGHTEASVDLMRIAGLELGAVICEILDADGETAHGEVLLEMARQWNIGIISVDTIARYRQEHTISLITETQLPTPEATFKVLDYQEIATGQHYLALVLGDLQEFQQHPPLLRLHSSCTTGDIFGSQRCDCQAQLHSALHIITKEGQGLLLYLPQEGRGIGLGAKLQAYALQDQGYDTVDANTQLGYPVDARSYTTAIEILRTLHISHVRLMTNSPHKVQTLTDAGIIVERIPIEITPNTHNTNYLNAKYQRLGHMLTPLNTSLDTDRLPGKENSHNGLPTCTCATHGS